MSVSVRAGTCPGRLEAIGCTGAGVPAGNGTASLACDFFSASKIRVTSLSPRGVV